MNKNKNVFSAVILAAGNSIRMGVPKFSLKFNSKHTFIEHTAHEYCELGCKEIVIVVNESGLSTIKERKFNFPDIVKIVVNEHPEWDRFYSLKTGLQSLSKIQPVFIVNVDNPFVNIEINKALLDSIECADYICPAYKNSGGHPVLLNEKIVKDIVDEKQNQLHFREYLQQYTKKAVIVDDEKVLININTPEEYQFYFTRSFGV